MSHSKTCFLTVKIERGTRDDKEAIIKIYGDRTSQDVAYELINDIINEDIGRNASYGKSCE